MHPLRPRPSEFPAAPLLNHASRSERRTAGRHHAGSCPRKSASARRRAYPVTLTMPSSTSNARIGAVRFTNWNPSTMCSHGERTALNSRRGVHIHHHQSSDHRDVASAVCEEAPALPQSRHQHSSDRRTDDTRPVEHGGVQRDGIHQVVFAHHIHKKRLPAREYQMRSQPQTAPPARTHATLSRRAAALVPPG